MFSFRRSAPAAVLLLALGLAAAAGRADLPAGASPFLPPAAAAAAASSSPDTALELRGIMAAGDTVMFSIYDTSRRTSAWTKLNEVGRDYIVRTYDSSKDTVTVDFQGRTIALALHTAKVVSAPINFAPPPGLSPVPPPIGGPVVLNPTPADEQRRLEAIAAEVNRRRMMRQQALQASREAASQQQLPPPGPPNSQR